jgi:FixJ family two-component response regulator
MPDLEQTSPGPQGQNPLGHVLLVEDDAAVRASLALLLQLHGYGTAEFASAEEFLTAPAPRRPACALVDVGLPGMSGIALQARMIRDRHAPPVLLMTAHGDEALARTALLQGAVDFLDKPIDETALLAAVSAGLSSDRERRIRNRERDAVTARIGTLTRHEAVLFERITDGRQAREIAEEFGVTVDVLEGQRTRLMEKLAVTRVTDLFRLRFRLGEVLSDRAGAA